MITPNILEPHHTVPARIISPQLKSHPRRFMRYYAPFFKLLIFNT